MKSKKNLYFLVPAVLIIWSLIGYRIYKAIASPKTPTNIVINNSEFKPTKINTTKPYNIKANYRDPFLGTMARSSKKKKATSKKTKEVVVFPKIVYKGMIAPKTKNKPAVYLIQINGKQNFLKVNAIIDEVKLIKGNNKEVVLEYKKTRKSFPIQ